MSTVIEVNNIGKRYKLRDAHVQYKNFTDMASQFIRLPYNYLRQLIHGERPAPRKETFWALDNINFKLQQGDVLGILGRNGSGKSTLLKVLSRVTTPTRGTARIIGRIGSLLEVGTGFHPELTGRENVFLNGIIIGMTRNEVKSKFDEIVEFSGVSRFLDMPVKHYSSGMFMRLAFSVAVHLEPEILIIDEVLAVGDIDFQEKCLKKMKSFRDLGHTILFVSHNIRAVQDLTDKALLLAKGKQIDFGHTGEVVSNYINNYSGEDDHDKISSFRINNFKVKPCGSDYLHTGGHLEFSFEFESEQELADPKIVITINTSNEYNLCGLLANKQTLDVEKLPRHGRISCVSDALYFTEGMCMVQLTVLDGDNPVFQNLDIANIFNNRAEKNIFITREWADYCVNARWKLR